MIRTQIYLLQKQLLQLKQLAFEKDISVSEAVRKIIEKEFSQRQVKTKAVKRKYKSIGVWLLS